MTIDVTSITAVAKEPVNSRVQSRAATNVVPFKQSQTEQPTEEVRQAKSVDVNRAASQVNDFVKQIGRNLEFSVHEGSGRVIITVRESDTGKIVRQIPPEELLVIADLVRDNLESATAPPGILLADEG